jgi:hypothetical protein
MNASNFNIIYEKFKDRIYELFGILTAKELFQILDEDNDGFMNEDEQVLFFSIIKTKMLRCAQELLVIFRLQAVLRADEVCEVRRLLTRQLEKNINSYQDTLRQNIYNNELIKYKEVGRDKLDEFFDKYERKFEEVFQSKT